MNCNHLPNISNSLAIVVTETLTNTNTASQKHTRTEKIIVGHVFSTFLSTTKKKIINKNFQVNSGVVLLARKTVKFLRHPLLHFREFENIFLILLLNVFIFTKID